MSLENKPAAAPSSNWKEQLLPDEEKLHADHLLAFEEISKIKDAKYGKGRQLHRKAQLGLHGRFEVLSGLPDYAKFGLFAAPATYDAWIRLSNGGMDRASDRKPDIRGFSIKIRGLKGPGALGSGDTDCQDFLLIQRSAFGFATSEDFVGFVHHAALGPGSLFKYLFSTFGLIGGFRKLNKLAKALKIPFTGFATEKFYTATNIEAAAFDPWNALIEHRPLGEVMRARKVVYFQSQLGRKAKSMSKSEQALKSKL